MKFALEMLIFARGGRNSAANKWLAENPTVLGLIFLVIGVAALAWGVVELMKGTATDKRGNQLSGGTAMALSIIRIVAGVGFSGFGIYKMVAG